MTDAHESEIYSDHNQEQGKCKKIAVSDFIEDRVLSFEDPGQKNNYESKNQKGESSLAPAMVRIQPKPVGGDRHSHHQKTDDQIDGYTFSFLHRSMYSVFLIRLLQLP